MLLYLLRHGIAIDRDHPDSPPEEDRFLTERGLDRTRRAVAGARALEMSADVLLSSPWLRARQTAEICVAELDLDTEIEPCDALLWDAPPSELFEVLQGCDADRVLCTGHAPHLDNMIAAALGAPHVFTSLKKAGLAILEGTAPRPSSFVLRGLYAPKALRKLAGS